MSSSIESLNKILKDETRRKILLLLNDKQSLSYTDLMETLKIGSTGTLNYHLKVLGELLEKNEAGQYMLTEKGNVAVRFLTVFPEQDGILEAKKTWWRRYWIISIAIPASSLLIMLFLYFSGQLNTYWLARSITGFISAIVLSYFFYRMVRPIKRGNSSQIMSRDRSIEDFFVSGRQIQEIKEAVQSWIKEEEIILETQRDVFIRGRLGPPSGLGWTAPKYFEVSWKAEPNGVLVHTEGWISVYDLRERSFSSTALAYGGVPRKKGWRIMQTLINNLKAISK
jgi:DNA-binding transcriptional ArsR family regulator